MPIHHYGREFVHYQIYPQQVSEKSDQTIVLIHGLGMDLSSWDPVIPELSRDYQLIAYDLRGHGKSSATGQMRNFQGLIDDLHEVIGIGQIARVHLIGHGLGGIIAVWYAEMYPDRIQSVALISSHLYYPSVLVDEMIAHRRSLTLEGSLEPLAVDMISRIVLTTDESIQTKLYAAFCQITVASYFKFFQFPRDEYDLLDRLPHIHVPVLHVAGAKDQVSPAYYYGFSTNLFPNAQFVILPDASNAVHLDQPQLFSRLVMDHVERTKTESIFKAKKSRYDAVFQKIALYGALMNKVASSIIQVNCLNGFQFIYRGQEIEGSWNKRKAKEIILYLVFHPMASREELGAVLWPHLSADKMRNQLRVSLHHLKNLLLSAESELTTLLAIDKSFVSLKGVVNCDLIELSESLSDVLNERDEYEKKRRGQEILNDLPFDILQNASGDWLYDFRERLESQLIELAEWIASLYYRDQHFSEALHYYKIAANYMTINAEVYDRIHEIYVAQGDKDRAVFWIYKKNEVLYS